MTSVLEAHNLSKAYGMKYAVQNASITIHEGDICGLVGRNGAGKTTLFKLIAGVTEPTAGSLTLFGDDDLKTQRERLGVLIEQPFFLPYLTAEENLVYYQKQKGIVERSLVTEALVMTGLYGDRKQKVQTYSLGMKQRLGIGLALLGDPDFLILDEPTNGIDHANTVELRELLLRLNKERRVTMLLSSHLLTELFHLATRYIVIDQGIIIDQLTNAELEQQTRNSIRIESDQASRVAVILEEKFGLKEYTIDGEHNLLLFEGFDLIPAITNALVLGGVSLWGIHKQQTELETYFLQKIGDTHA